MNTLEGAKVCKDCRHYVKWSGEYYETYHCYHKRAIPAPKTSWEPVHGKHESKECPIECDTMRDEGGACGPAAVLFEEA